MRDYFLSNRKFLLFDKKTLRVDRTPADWNMLLTATRRRRRVSQAKLFLVADDFDG